jgi:hypothetical protein
MPKPKRGVQKALTDYSAQNTKKVVADNSYCIDTYQRSSSCYLKLDIWKTLIFLRFVSYIHFGS